MILFELNPLSVGLSVWFLLISEQVAISSSNFFEDHKLSGLLYVEG